MRVQDHHGSLNNKLVFLILSILILVGFYLRLRNLGELGFKVDEKYFSLAVKGIFENGYPLLPSGMIYIRSGLILYLHAFSAMIFGLNEFALRLPAVLFGVSTIPLAYFFSARLFDKYVGLIVAAALTISFFEIELSRNARMYTPFAFFYLLTVFSFYKNFIEGKKGYTFITTLLAVFTITIHDLGFTLALFYLFPFFMKDYRIVSRSYLILNFTIITSFVFLWRKLSSVLFNLAQIDQGLLLDSNSQQTAASGFFDLIAGVVSDVIGKLYLPSFELFSSLYHNAFPGIIFLGLIILVYCIFYYLYMQRASLVEHTIFLFIVGSSLFHQFTLTFIFFLLYIFIQNRGIAVLRVNQVNRLGMAIGISCFIWFSYALLLWVPDQALMPEQGNQLRESIKALFGYPRLKIFWGFVIERPIMSFVAAFGFLWCFHLASQQHRKTSAYFLILAFAIPHFVNSMFGSLYDHFRYSFHLDVFYFTFFALGLLRWYTVLEIILAGNEAGSSMNPAIRRLDKLHIKYIGSSLLLLAVVATTLNPLKSWLITEATYGKKELFGLVTMFYPDHKTTGMYVKDHLEKDDIVIVLDSREQYDYIGRTDYWIMSSYYEPQTYWENGRFKDLYTGTPLIRSLEGFKEILDKYRCRRIWLVASTDRHQRWGAVSDEIMNYYNVELASNVVYVGKDQDSKVYLLDRHSEGCN